MGLKSLKKAIKNPFKFGAKAAKSAIKPKNLLNLFAFGAITPMMKSIAKFAPRKWNIFARGAGSLLNLTSKATTGEKPYYGYGGLKGDMQDPGREDKALQEQLASASPTDRENYEKWMQSPGQYQEQLAELAKRLQGGTATGRFSKFTGPVIAKKVGGALGAIDQSVPGSYASQAGEARAQDELKRRRYSGTLLTSPSASGGALAQAAGGSSGKTLLGQ